MAVLAVALFLVLLIISAGLFFKVTDIVVVGNSVVLAEDVRNASGMVVGDNIFLVNKFEASHALFDSFPYIREVSISRVLPGKVIIEIKESVPASAFSFANFFWLVDSDGRILERRALLGEGVCPLVVGAEVLAPAVGQKLVVSEEETEKIYSLLEILKALEELELLEETGTVDVSRAYDVRLVYQGRMEVRVGYPNDLQYKLSYIKPALAQLEQEQEATLDVTAAREKNVMLIPKS